jgi:hypothetical protein
MFTIGGQGGQSPRQPLKEMRVSGFLAARRGLHALPESESKQQSP